MTPRRQSAIIFLSSDAERNRTMHKVLALALLIILCFEVHGGANEANPKNKCPICKGQETISRFVPCDKCNGTGVIKSYGSGGIVTHHTTHLRYIGTSITTTSRSGKVSTISKRCPKCKNSTKRGYIRKNVPCKCTTEGSKGTN